MPIKHKDTICNDTILWFCFDLVWLILVYLLRPYY